MEKENLQSVSSGARNRKWQLWAAVLFTLLLNSSLYGQEINWVKTALDSEPLSVLSESVMDVHFIPLNNIENGKLNVNLAAGIEYVETSNGTGHEAGTYTVTPSGDAGSGKSLLIEFDESTLLAGIPVHLQIKVYALCDAVDGTIGLKILSDETEKGSNSIEYTVQVPVIRMTTTTPFIDYEEQDDKNVFNLSVSASGGVISAFQIILDYDKGVVLEEFLLDNETISSVEVKETQAIITLTKDDFEKNGDIESGKLDETARVVTFKASAARCGAYKIYTAAAFDCEIYDQDSPDLTMSYPTEAGLPSLNYEAALTYFLKDDMSSKKDVNSVCMDGETVTYYRVAYTNIGSADAYEIVTYLQPYRQADGKYAYIADKDSPIQYSIDGGLTISPLEESDYTKTELLKSNTRRVIKEGMENEYSYVTVRIPEPLKVGKVLMIYYPVAAGAIYDNSGVDFTTKEANTISSLNFMRYGISSVNACGEVGGASTGTYGGGGSFNYPRITSTLPKKSVPVGGSGETRFNLYSGQNTTTRSLDILVQLPSWLDLDGSITDAFKYGSYTPHSSTVVDAENKIYSISFISLLTNADVVLKYKVSDNIPSYEENQDEQILFWVNWNMGDECNTKLEYFTRAFQDITLVCNRTGILLEEFSLNRITRGLKDNDTASGNGIPDDGTEAMNDDINHSLYLRNDLGKMIFKAKISETEEGTYPRLYLLLHSENINLAGNNISLSKGTLKRGDNTEEEIEFKKYNNSNNKYYLEYIPAEPFGKEDELLITLPFTTKEPLGSNGGITAECYVANAAPANIFEHTTEERFGDDMLSVIYGSYQEAFSVWKSVSDPFKDNVPMDMWITRFMGLGDTPMPSPYFKQEARHLAYPQTYEVEIPAGYRIVSDLKVVATSVRGFTGQSLTTPVKTVVSNPSGSTTYTYDLTKIWDGNYTDQNVIENRWPYPDDSFNYYMHADIQATKSATYRSNINAKVTYKDNVNNKIDSKSHVVSIVYSGETIILNAPTDALTAYGTKLQLAPVQIGNPNTSAINNVWLYVGGNAGDLRLTSTSNDNITPPDGSFEGRWLKIGNQLAAGFSRNYALEFSYTGTSSEESDIELYLVSGFGSNWSPDISQGIEALGDNDMIEYVSLPVRISVAAASARVNGSLSVSTNTFEYKDPYTVTAQINSEASAGILRKPVMKITIPRGQQYQPGSAKIEYPRGSGAVDVSQAIEDVLLELDGEDLPDSFEFELDFAAALGKSDLQLPGYMFEGVNKNDQVAIFTARFAPQCDTRIQGDRYYGTLSGETSVEGGIAEGSGRTVISEQMRSDITSSYKFTVTPSFQINNESGKTVFNEKQTTNALVIDIRKAGNGSLDLKDALSIELPDIFTLAGDQVAVSSDNMSLSVSNVAIRETVPVSNGRQVVRIELPQDDYESDGVKGNNKTVRFTIPVIYTPTDEDKSNPVHKLDIDVVTMAAFGNCAEVTYGSIGSANLDVAVVRTTSNPYGVAIDSTVDLQVESDGFEGKWYNTDKTTELSSENPYEYTPTAEGKTTLYVSAVFDGINYGKVPVEVIVHPSLTFETKNKWICVGEQVDLADLVSGIAKTEGKATLTYYGSDEETKLLETEVAPSSTTTYYVQASVIAEGVEFKNEMIPLTITVTEQVAISSVSKGNLYVNYGGTIELKVEPSDNTLSYQWYKDGNKLSGATNSTYTIATATPTSHAGSYYVEVTGCNTVSSELTPAIVSVYPDLTITLETPLYMCDTEETGVDLSLLVGKENGIELEYYIKDGEKLSCSVVKPSATTIYEVKPKNAGGTYGLTGEITVIVENAPRIVTHPQSRYLNAGSAPLQVIATGDNISYQWQKEVSGVYTDISGAQADIYDATETGRYRVVITGVTTACGTLTVISNPATVSVYTPPTMETYRIRTEAEFGEVIVTLYPNDNWSIPSGSFVDGGVTIKVTAIASSEWSGLELTELTANGQPISNGQLLQIWEDTDIYAKFQVDGHDPDPDPGVGNVKVGDNGLKIWVAEEILYVRTEEVKKAYVVSLSGTIVAARDLSIGENQFWLPRGAYIVRIGDEVTKVIVR